MTRDDIRRLIDASESAYAKATRLGPDGYEQADGLVAAAVAARLELDEAIDALFAKAER